MNKKTINEIKKAMKEEEGEHLEKNNMCCVLDEHNSLMYIAKNKNREKIFKIISDDEEYKNVPNHFFRFQGYQKCRFSKEYLQTIFETILYAPGDTVTICVKEGYPLIIEDYNNAFVLVPRAQGENNINIWDDSEILL